MSKVRTFLLAILIMFTSLFGGCESDEDVDEPPQTRDSGVQAGEAVAGESAGEVMAGEAAGEESVSGTSDAGEEPIVAGDLVPAGDEPEVAGDLVLPPAGETPAGDQIEDCEPEFQTDEGCEPPENRDSACEPESLEDCDDMPVPAGEESSEDAPTPDMGS